MHVGIYMYTRSHFGARAVQHYTSRLTRVFVQSLGGDQMSSAVEVLRATEPELLKGLEATFDKFADVEGFCNSSVLGAMISDDSDTSEKMSGLVTPLWVSLVGYPPDKENGRTVIVFTKAKWLDVNAAFYDMSQSFKSLPALSSAPSSGEKDGVAS